MTDHDNESMTDEPEITDDIADASTFEKREQNRFGQRGEEHFGVTQTETDIDEMTEVKDTVVTSYCKCGVPHLSVGDTYRCCQCDDMCCTDCHIEMTRRHYCPDCAEQAYGLNKATYLALYLLDKGELDPADLVTAETVDTELDTVTIDPAATTLLDHDYLRTGDTGIHTGDTATTVGDEDDPITAAGKEALHIGDQLYSDDPDVETLKEELAIREATTR